MRRPTLLLTLLAALACCAQAPSPAMKPRDRQEFPLLLHSNVTAGKTVAGAPVQGKLVMATLVRGTVIPAGAVFTGTVEESTAKSGDTPSRLKLHITAAKWNEHTIAVDLYVTNHCFPEPGQFLDAIELRDSEYREAVRKQSRAHGAKLGIENGYPPRVKLKDVELERAVDGTIAITSPKERLRLHAGLIYSFEGSAGEAEKPAAQ